VRYAHEIRGDQMVRRRDVLKMAALAPWATLTHADIGRRRTRPTDPEWPGKELWQSLNRAVGANLIEVRSLMAACTAGSNSKACVDVTQQLHNPFYIADQPGGTQVSGWLDAWMPASSAYAIRARSASDVVAGVNFARAHNLRLVVKGTGHSYLGTSNAPDSLLIWTRAMNAVQLEDAFVPRGCIGTVAPVPAVTAQPGAVSIDLYDAVTHHAGRYVQAGGCTDTGVAGLIQSGGFGSFSKGFGSAAANLLEAEVVTADGLVRVANTCTNPDLFWALKGGGGGSFGVITRLTLRTHELPKTLGGASMKVKATTDTAFRALIARFIRLYADSLFNPQWGEQVKFNPDNTLEISMSCQGLDRTQAYDIWRPFAHFVTDSPDDYLLLRPLLTYAAPSQTFWDIQNNPSMVHDTRVGSPHHHGWWRGDQDQVGSFIHGFESLWLPASLLAPEAQPRLVDALLAASRFKQVQLHMNKGLGGAALQVREAARHTAMNPAVLDAFTLVIIADGEAAAYPGLAREPMDLSAARADAGAIDRAAAQLRKIAPDSGSYLSESNYFNRSWQRDYWGSHYERLRDIKKTYDPDGLFIVHHGVGSEDWSPDGFTRL
jgi:FAD/FMN-containing dehydrogenase